ncbi:MAG: SCO family protein [Mesorhizobium sp.]
MRAFLYVLLFLIAGAVGWFGFQQYNRFFGEDAYGVSFKLVDQTGQPISERELRAQPSAVFFGFTHCPEICPTTLYELDQWLGKLGPDADKLRAFFVTVDPARDTPEVMNLYVSNVSKRITGITGSPEEVEAMVRGYNIYFKKVDTGGGDYTMDHTAAVILLDRGGGFAGTIAYEENPETAIAKLKRLADKS